MFANAQKYNIPTDAFVLKKPTIIETFVSETIESDATISHTNNGTSQENQSYKKGDDYHLVTKEGCILDVFAKPDGYKLQVEGLNPKRCEELLALAKKNELSVFDVKELKWRVDINGLPGCYLNSWEYDRIKLDIPGAEYDFLDGRLNDDNQLDGMVKLRFSFGLGDEMISNIEFSKNQIVSGTGNILAGYDCPFTIQKENGQVYLVGKFVFNKSYKKQIYNLSNFTSTIKDIHEQSWNTYLKNKEAKKKAYERTHPLKKRKCTICNGRGVCMECNGRGARLDISNNLQRCYWCNGRGTCSKCGGDGIEEYR